MHSIGPKITLYALVAAAGAVASSNYLDLKKPFPGCAVAAVISATFSTPCHEETLECVCKDVSFFDDLAAAIPDHCDDYNDISQALSILLTQCSRAGFPLPTSTWPLIPTETGSLPPFSGSHISFHSWSIPASESASKPCDTSITTTTTTSPCATTTEIPTTSPCPTTTKIPTGTGWVNPTTPVTNATLTKTPSATNTPSPLATGGAKGRGEKAAGMVGLVGAALCILALL